MPWDITWPGEKACGKKGTHVWELSFYLDGYNEPGVVRHQTRMYFMWVCDKHAEYMPRLRIVGEKAKEMPLAVLHLGQQIAAESHLPKYIQKRLDEIREPRL